MGSIAPETDAAHGASEDSETTIEIKIKTLDSQTYSLRVNKCVPVPLLKEKIADVTGIISEQQRLICRGRVLKDDELLSAYHVEDGHTLHLVGRQPGQSTSEGNTGHEATTLNAGRPHGTSVSRSIVLEAVNVDPGSSEFSSIGQIISSVLSSLGATNAGSYALRTDDLGVPASDETGSFGPTISLPNPASVRVELDSQHAPLFQSEAPFGLLQPNVIPDSLTTIFQYLEFMRAEFRRAGFNTNGTTETNVDNGTAGVQTNGVRNNDSESNPASRVHGLPSASSLAEALRSTRDLLTDQARECLSRLSSQLENPNAPTERLTSRSLQARVMSCGFLLQYLGSLFLELGRTTTMIRMGDAAPSEAIVNSGPALFISPSGPNPLMVQHSPFFPGSSSAQMGGLFSGLGLQGERLGSVLRPRDVDIHIRAGRVVPAENSSASEPAGAQQAQEPITDRTSASHVNIGHEAFSGLMGAAPFNVEPGVGVMPLRTVVAVPAGVSRPPSDSPSGGIGLIYPLLARVQQVSSVNAGDARSTESPNEPARTVDPASQQIIPEPSSEAQNSNSASRLATQSNIGASPVPGSNPVEAGRPRSIHINLDSSSQGTLGQQNGQSPVSQLLNSLQWLGTLFTGELVRGSETTGQESGPGPHAVAGSLVEQLHATRNADIPEAPVVNDEAISFSNMLRQIMPYISVGAGADRSGTVEDNQRSSAQAVSDSSGARDGGINESNSSQHQRDQIEGPDPKRQRKS